MVTEKPVDRKWHSLRDRKRTPAATLAFNTKMIIFKMERLFVDYLSSELQRVSVFAATTRRKLTKEPPKRSTANEAS